MSGLRSSGAVLALDVGGTFAKGAVVAPDGTLLHEARAPTGAGSASTRPDGVAAVLDSLVDDLAARAVAETGQSPLAACVAAPGVVDPVAGVVRFSANIAWSDVPLRDRVAARLGTPVRVVHDVRAAALAEARLGRGRTCADFVFVAIGTGIGGALVLGGAPYDGAHGLACEIGHLVVDPGGEACGCGSAGCLETVASAASIARRYLARAAGTEAGGTGVDAAEVFRRAGRGDETAAGVLAEAFEALAAAVAACQTFADVELFVLGGGLSLAGEGVLAPLVRRLAGRLGFRPVPRVEASTLGSRGGCVGAGICAWELVSRRRSPGGWPPAARATPSRQRRAGQPP